LLAAVPAGCPRGAGRAVLAWPPWPGRRDL